MWSMRRNTVDENMFGQVRRTSGVFDLLTLTPFQVFLGHN